MNQSVLLHRAKQQIVAWRAFALASLLIFPLFLGAQTGILDTQSQGSQNPLNPQQSGSRTPFPVIPERPKVNITNIPGSPEASGVNQLPNVALPPEPDIEFQQFVASSLGYNLPIFGQNLFENVPSTFAPLEYVPVTPDYLIGPGDELDRKSVV